MALRLRTQSFRSIFITSRGYCEKSIYQKHEEGEQPRLVYGKPYPEWRKPWIKREGEWKPKLSLFIEKNPSPDALTLFSRIPDLTMAKVKSWWQNMKDLQEIENQKYLSERIVALGANLAAVHFFTYRHCAVRLKNSNTWIKGDATNLKLPDQFIIGYYVEAIDCTDFHHNGIRYEGFENLKGLNYLKWLSVKSNKYVDVWCLDRLAGLHGNSLEFLDISGCQLDVGCVFALARMKALKMLIVTDPGDNLELQSALSMLEEENSQLVIRAIAPGPSIKAVEDTK